MKKEEWTKVRCLRCGHINEYGWKLSRREIDAAQKECSRCCGFDDDEEGEDE